MPRFNAGFGTLYLSVVLLSLNGLFARSIALDSTSITQLRSVIAGLALAALIRLQRRSLGIPRGKRALVYGLGILLGLHWITFFKAMQVSSVAVGILALFTHPVFTVLLEPIFHRKTPKLRDLIAASIVIVGIAIMVSSQLSGAQHNAAFQQLSVAEIRVGVFWGVLSAVLFAARNTAQKYWLHQIPSSNIMLHQVIIIALMLAVFCDWQRALNLPGEQWLLLALLGVFCTAGAHTLVSASLKHLAAKTVALISCLQPLLAALFAWLVLAEAPSPQVALGGAIIVGVAIYESRAKV